MRVLLVDDDVALTEMLAEYLAAEGFVVEAVHDGGSGAQKAVDEHYDAVVLDVMLPEMNGIDVLRAIRVQSHVPVLMLTAKGDDVDRIVGLELGADDYIPKPFNPRELAARLRAILRRTRAAEGGAGEEALRVGDLEMRPGERIALWKGRPLELTSTEFNLLEVLARNAGHVVSKAQASEQGLGRPLARFDRGIDMHVSNLRRKLGTLADGRSPIQTVRGMGYQLLAG